MARHVTQDMATAPDNSRSNVETRRSASTADGMTAASDESLRGTVASVPVSRLRRALGAGAPVSSERGPFSSISRNRLLVVRFAWNVAFFALTVSRLPELRFLPYFRRSARLVAVRTTPQHRFLALDVVTRGRFGRNRA